MWHCLQIEVSCVQPQSGDNLFSGVNVSVQIKQSIVATTVVAVAVAAAVAVAVAVDDVAVVDIFDVKIVSIYISIFIKKPQQQKKTRRVFCEKFQNVHYNRRKP